MIPPPSWSPSRSPLTYLPTYLHTYLTYLLTCLLTYLLTHYISTRTCWCILSIPCDTSPLQVTIQESILSIQIRTDLLYTAYETKGGLSWALATTVATTCLCCQGLKILLIIPATDAVNTLSLSYLSCCLSNCREPSSDIEYWFYTHKIYNDIYISAVVPLSNYW